MNLDKVINNGVKSATKSRIYFIAKDYVAFGRYATKHQLNVRDFCFVSNERVLHSMPEGSAVFALEGWEKRFDEPELRKCLLLMNVKVFKISINDVTDVMMAVNT